MPHPFSQQQQFGQPQGFQQLPTPSGQFDPNAQRVDIGRGVAPVNQVQTQPFGQQQPLQQQGPVVDAFNNTLNRAPDQQGLEFWRAQLAAGRPIEEIQASMMASPEGQRLAAGGTNAAIPTGLIGSELALTQGLDSQLGAINQFGNAGLSELARARGQSNQAINQGRNDVNANFNQAVQGLQPFQQGGTAAFGQQAALSGAQGPEAQRAAFEAFNASPGQQFLQDQGRRQVLSGAAATGGLGGGEVQRDLTRFGQGLAQQDFGNQFARLGQLSSQGQNAATNIGNFRGQQGNALGNLSQFQAGQDFNFGQAGSNSLINRGNNISNVVGNTANNLSQGRTNFGINQANALTNAGNSLADFQNAGGSGASDIIGSAATNAGNAQTSFGNLSAGDQQQVMTLLSNLATQQGTNVANVQNPQPNALNTFGQVAGIAGATADAFGNRTPQTVDQATDEMINDADIF